MERFTLWAKILAVVLPLAAIGIAWGTLRSDVQHVEHTVAVHVESMPLVYPTRTEVGQLQAEILRRLDRIERKLDAEAAR